MPASVLPANTHLTDRTRVDYAYPTASPTAHRSQVVSLGACLRVQTKDLQTKERPTKASPERRNKVRFAEDIKPVDTMAANTNINVNNINRVNKNMAKSGSRPAGKSIETQELTSVDKKWGVLFLSSGQPTARFVEAMSSLSRYIVRQPTMPVHSSRVACC